MQILTDAEWSRLKQALEPVRPGTGHPFPETRRTVPAGAAGRIGRVVCDRACSSEPWQARIRAGGGEPVAPGNPAHRRAPAHDMAAQSFPGGVCLAAAIGWLSNRA
ncbi:hypothetical protein [Azospirillum thermophilum]|uniref:Uncharacterized protein n=1 Tax=Azospirillum thermophilum TaxID=2202148 RepID=A0A2S2CS25_9PROT|nr:hypothetical protein [Azospirillum thermophilum]AWK87323.1 hypothetical protein DEW08_14830 [Azospirillum thermophilum]